MTRRISCALDLCLWPLFGVIGALCGGPLLRYLRDTDEHFEGDVVA